MAILRNLNELTREQLIEQLLAERATPAPRALTLKVSEKGGVSVYGLGRFPVTLYAASWERLLDAAQAKTILDFIATNAALVSRKA